MYQRIKTNGAAFGISELRGAKEFVLQDKKTIISVDNIPYTVRNNFLFGCNQWDIIATSDTIEGLYPSPPKKKCFEKGDYIVILITNDLSSAYLVNYVYKQRQNLGHISSVLDSRNSSTNSWGYIEFSKNDMWRYATPEEIAMYDKEGKPIDTKLVVKEDSMITETMKPNSATSPKNIKDLKYPDVVHVETKEQHDKLIRVHPRMSNWESRYSYYLIGGFGVAETRQAYETDTYTIYEMSQVIIDEASTEIEIFTYTIYEMSQVIIDEASTEIEIFTGIRIGDIVVSKDDFKPFRKKGEMFKVLPQSTRCKMYYIPDKFCSNSTAFRKATPYEALKYELGIRNTDLINTKEPTSTSQKWRFKTLEEMREEYGVVFNEGPKKGGPSFVHSMHFLLGTEYKGSPDNLVDSEGYWSIAAWMITNKPHPSIVGPSEYTTYKPEITSYSPVTKDFIPFMKTIPIKKQGSKSTNITGAKKLQRTVSI